MVLKIRSYFECARGPHAILGGDLDPANPPGPCSRVHLSFRHTPEDSRTKAKEAPCGGRSCAKSGIARHTVEEYQGTLPKDDRQVVPGDSRSKPCSILRTIVSQSFCLGLYRAVPLLSPIAHAYSSPSFVSLMFLDHPACTADRRRCARARRFHA